MRPSLTLFASTDAIAESAAESLRSNLPTESTASALAVPTIRDDWVVRQIANRVRDFTTTSQLRHVELSPAVSARLTSGRLFVATYNIAETSPSEALADWLADAKDADLVVIGLQEVDMRPQALLSGRPNVEKEMAWSRAISSALRQAGASTSIRVCKPVTRRRRRDTCRSLRISMARSQATSTRATALLTTAASPSRR